MIEASLFPRASALLIVGLWVFTFPLHGDTDDSAVAVPSQCKAASTEPVPVFAERPSSTDLYESCGMLNTMVLTMFIRPDGGVEDVRTLRSTGCEYADQEIAKCVRAWCYQPACSDSAPVRTTNSLVINWGYPNTQTPTKSNVFLVCERAAELWAEDVEEGSPCAPVFIQAREKGELSVEAATVGASACRASGWAQLLELALRQSPEAKETLLSLAPNASSGPHRKLVQVLLEEWELESTAPTLSQPRIVHAPKPDYSDLNEASLPLLKTPLVVATGEVTVLGAVENVELQSATGVEEIDRRCLEAFERWLFRPARGKGRYKRGKAGITCHVHLE